MDVPPNAVASDAWLAAIVASSADAIVSKTLEGIVTSWNGSAERIFGYSAEEMLGQSIVKIIPRDRLKEESEILATIRRGEHLDHFETIRQRKDGTLVDISLTASPIMSADGRILGVSKIARDITEERRSRDTQRLLMREVNHRSKNLLAVIEAMVRQTVENTPPSNFAGAVSRRITGLARSQDLIVGGDWQGVQLRDLLLAHAVDLPAEELDRFTFSGPDVRISPGAAQAMGLSLHELFVGAVHRLRRSLQGTIAVKWSTDQDGKSLAFAWIESLGDGNAVNEAGDTFANTVLRKVVPVSVNGVATLIPSGAGWRWTLTTKSDVAFGPQIVDPLGQGPG